MTQILTNPTLVEPPRILARCTSWLAAAGMIVLHPGSSSVLLNAGLYQDDCIRFVINRPWSDLWMEGKLGEPEDWEAKFQAGTLEVGGTINR